MTGVFDGMAGVLSDVLGAPVTIQPIKTGGFSTVQAIFRKDPIEVPSEDGEPVLMLSPTLKVRRDLVPAIERGDLVEPTLTPGVQYRVVNTLPTGSPASDGFILCELEEVT